MLMTEAQFQFLWSSGREFLSSRCQVFEVTGAVGRKDIVWSWIFLIVGSCGHHIIASAVDLVFLTIWGCWFVWKRVQTYLVCNASGNDDSQRIAHNGSHTYEPIGQNHSNLTEHLGASISHRIADGCCIFLFLAYLSVAGWSGFVGWRDGWSNFPLLPAAAAVIQSVAWLVMSISARNTARRRRSKYPVILRSWWCVTFLFSLLDILGDICLFARYESLSFINWVDMLSILASATLCVVALTGRTGLDRSRQPLLAEHVKPIKHKITPYATAGLLSRATMSWLNPLLSVGYHKALELKDIPSVAPNESAESCYTAFKSNWDKAVSEGSSKIPALTLILGKTFWRGAVWNGIFAVVNSVATYVGPYFLVDFVEYLGGKERFAYEGYILVVLLFGSKLVETLTQRQWQFGTQVLSLHLRSVLTAIVYRKGLRLSSQSRMNHASGEIINYMAVDVERVGDFTWYIHDIWVGPLQVFLALAILYKNVGLASLAALAATILTLFANQPIADIYEKYQGKLMEAKDERMKALSECLRSMRILKLQAWEMRYLGKLEKLRKVEYDWLGKTLYAAAASTFVFWTAPMFVAAVTFGTCVLMNIPLTAGRILSALATFRALQTPLDTFPEFVTILAQTKVSLDRIRKYLQDEELQTDAVIRVPCGYNDVNEKKLALEIKGGRFSWDPAAEVTTLRGINLQVRRGEKVAICGVVGSGKSSLLSCMFGEIPKLAGTVKLSGSTAYVLQSPWIQSGTIEDNIRFGSRMDHEKYANVLKVCALEKDLELFAYGDQTLIGERGINLSGGQKQRVQLARAVYQDADIYLLDDPFSAVDAHTGTDLFKECILGALSTKTVIFVTHQVEFLPAADLILVLRAGEIVQAGKYGDLLQAGTDFSTLVRAHNEAIDFMDVHGHFADEDEDVYGSLPALCDDDAIQADDWDDKTEEKDCKTQNGLDIPPVNNKYRGKDAKTHEKPRLQLLEDEQREKGCVKFTVYWVYLTAVKNGALIPIIIGAQIVFQVLQIGSNYWMAWATPATTEEKQKISSVCLISVYVALAFGCAIFVLIRTVLVSFVGLLTAQKFCIDMLRCIFKAPMAFFDSTPTGRILSRASSDQSVMDLNIQFRFSGFMVSTVQLVGIIIVMAQMTWEVLLVFVPVAFICIWIQRYYMTSARELARFVGIQKAPIIHHYAESIAGAAAIRAFGQEQRFINGNFKSFDRYASPFFHNFAATEWLIIRMELLSTCVFAFSMVVVIMFRRGKIDPSMAGLAVAYGLQLNSMQSRWVWGMCNVENKVISAERIQQFIRVPSEAPHVIENSHIPKNWPSHGTIKLQNLQVRYSAHTPLVLHGITCTFPGGKRIGVVGRTGSGKSTLIQALFRMVEPVEGRIVIDGVDVSSIGLHDLRSKLSIIPQDPSLFEGTIRSNLDPLEEHTELEIWEALDKCQLGDVVRGKEGGLDSPVCENGENWSVGQRQLVCLGRALLKHTRILVLDEATASVDSATDGIIQRTLRSEFVDCTVVTVAHRIPTVVDSDYVLVLSEGRVAEYDMPMKLLEEKYTLFSKLVAEYSSRSSTVFNPQM